MKFAPKAPPKRVPKPEVKPEVVEDNSNSAQASELLRRVNERSLRKPKADKKVPASQVAWLGGVVNSTRSNKYLNRSSNNFFSLFKT
jgi:DNA-directed RNA polymerase III subunit RPC4